MAKKSATKKKRRSTNVPDTLRGFSVQATRLVYYLLGASLDDVVSLEHLDDVAVEQADGHVVAEQAKSYKSSNPLADRSVALWKTLRNWADDVSSNRLVPETTRFVVFAPGASPGGLATGFASAATTEEANAAVDTARDTLTEDGDWDVSDTALPEVKAFFACDPMKRAVLIKNCQVDTDTSGLDDSLRERLAAKLVGEDVLDTVLEYAHGWVKQCIDEDLERRLPPQISVRSFIAALTEFVRTYDRRSILRSVGASISDEQVAEEVSYRDYVRQLRLIELDDEEILEAVNDYLSSVIDRVEWAENGTISAAALDSFEQDLSRTWRNRRRQCAIAHANRTEVEQGTLLHIDCMLHDASLDGLTTPTSFVRGSWHSLADERTVGWHPAYDTLLDT